MKKDLIDSCINCGWRKSEFKQGRTQIICTNPKTYTSGYIIDNDETVPDWCELEDVEE